MKIGIAIIFFKSIICVELLTYIRIDTINGDTAKYFSKSGRYIELNKEGVLIVDGHKFGGMGTACGCTTRPHGYWIERY